MIKIVFAFLCQWLPPDHAEIATRQAVIETHWFTSDGFTKYNNPFGLMWKGKLQKFESVEDACCEYHRQIYSRYKPDEDYYEFLERLPYASDPLYIWKIKHVKLDL